MTGKIVCVKEGGKNRAVMIMAGGEGQEQKQKIYHAGLGCGISMTLNSGCRFGLPVCFFP
jgi:hypothetical protein